MEKKFKFVPSSLEQRKKFYEKEFDLEKVKNWFRKNKIEFPQICALDAGSDTGIIKDKKLEGYILYFKFSELKKKIEKYVPEDIYYDRNLYTNPKKVLKTLDFSDWKRQELVFDIDADNIKCHHGKKPVCKKCLRKALQFTIKLKNELEKLDYKKLRIVYSGRGYHIHSFDKKTFVMDIEERKRFVKRFKKFAIDPWVSLGYTNLIRMPFTLNGLVSRKVIPLKIKNG